MGRGRGTGIYIENIPGMPSHDIFVFPLAQVRTTTPPESLTQSCCLGLDVADELELGDAWKKS